MPQHRRGRSNEVDVFVTAGECRRELGEKLTKAIAASKTASPMRAEEMSPKLSLAVVLTTPRFPGCILGARRVTVV